MRIGASRRFRRRCVPGVIRLLTRRLLTVSNIDLKLFRFQLKRWTSHSQFIILKNLLEQGTNSVSTHCFEYMDPTVPLYLMYIYIYVDILSTKYKTFSLSTIYRPVNVSLCLGLPLWSWGGAVAHAPRPTEGGDHLAWATLHGRGLVAAQHQQATQVYWKGEAANVISQFSYSIKEPVLKQWTGANSDQIRLIRIYTFNRLYSKY